MRAHQQIGLMAHGFAHQAHQAHGALERFLSRLPGIVSRVSSGRVELQTREALLDVFGRARRRAFRIVIELLALAVGGIQISVASQPLVHPAAEQPINRLFNCFAEDVPASHFQTADHAHE